MIPVYSNVYFDFYTDTLQDYTVGEDVTWAQAIVGARLSDAMPEADVAAEPTAEAADEVTISD